MACSNFRLEYAWFPRVLSSSASFLRRCTGGKQARISVELGVKMYPDGSFTCGSRASISSMLSLRVSM
jgi:hypothetical protein